MKPTVIKIEGYIEHLDLLLTAMEGDVKTVDTMMEDFNKTLDAMEAEMDKLYEDEVRLKIIKSDESCPLSYDELLQLFKWYNEFDHMLAKFKAVRRNWELSKLENHNDEI